MSEGNQHLVIPDIDGVANFWASQNAWGVAVQHDADGEVTVTIGTDEPEDAALALLHHGVLHASRRRIDVQTVYLNSVASFRTRSEDTPIRIWGDDPRQPEHVHIQCQDIEEML